MKVFKKVFLAAVGLGILTAGCSIKKSDQALTTDIQARMFADPEVKAANLSVTVKNGEATLTGDVPDEGARYQAFKIASDTPGVKHVVDQMTMQAAQAAPPGAEAPENPASASPTPERTRNDAETNHQKRSTMSAKSMPDPMDAPPRQPAGMSAPGAPPPGQPGMARPASPPVPPQPVSVEIPAGTSVRIQMIDTVDSAVNHVGETFHASLASPIMLDNQIIVPAGTDVYAKLVTAKSAGHMTGQSQVALELVQMDFEGTTYALVSSEYKKAAASRTKRTAETVGGGAAIGAILGAVIGGGKGAAIGAGVGAGAGGVTEEATKAQQVRIPSETKLDFTLEQPVEVSYFPDRASSRR